MANDPHLELTAPAIWYLARLELQSGGVIGGTIPGVPLVLTGRSADLGWGITSSYLDDLDIHIEEVNPQNPDQYRTPEGWADFEARDSIIEVKDGRLSRSGCNGRPMGRSCRQNSTTLGPSGLRGM